MTLFEICIFRVATGQGKVREIWFFFKVREKSGNFANWSGNFIILAQTMCCSRYFDYLKCEKVLIFSLACFARSKLWKLVNLRTFYAKKLLKDFICFICRIRKVHFSELVKGIWHFSTARRLKGRKTPVFWSVKNWIWSGKSQWKVREFCFCMRVATLILFHQYFPVFH